MTKSEQLLELLEKWTASQGQAKGLADIEGIEAGDKDIARIMDIVDKSDGDTSKMLNYARIMAKSITSKDKAQRRAVAAMDLFPPEIGEEAATIFLAKW